MIQYSTIQIQTSDVRSKASSPSSHHDRLGPREVIARSLAEDRSRSGWCAQHATYVVHVGPPPSEWRRRPTVHGTGLTRTATNRPGVKPRELELPPCFPPSETFRFRFAAPGGGGGGGEYGPTKRPTFENTLIPPSSDPSNPNIRIHHSSLRVSIILLLFFFYLYMARYNQMKRSRYSVYHGRKKKKRPEMSQK